MSKDEDTGTKAALKNLSESARIDQSPIDST